MRYCMSAGPSLFKWLIDIPLSVVDVYFVVLNFANEDFLEYTICNI